ncbi:MAG: twin-arginine translocation signal domain-containing protein [Chloroflexi bacterium]|nr:twin-arginine translocation signal domain-containing protein [Chloroflexota bacterium]
MPKNHSNTKGDRQSRRSFLAKLGLGVAIAAIASLPLGNRARKAADPAAGAYPGFPGEDSIFHPAQDPRRNRSS